MIHKIQVTILILLVPCIALLMYLRGEGLSIKDWIYPGTPIVHVGGIPIAVEVVDSPSERARGLSGRSTMESPGMLFIFDSADYHGIWMKDMLFPIDIVWIDEARTVVHIDRGVQPDTYPKTFRPPVPVRYVIETEERYTETFGITIGATVRLPVGMGGE